jgi:DNA cross-link repair 1C protein
VLVNVTARVKDIQSVYIDTTFCVPQAMYIPSREESTDAAIDLIRDWLSLGPTHIIHLQYRADLGYENLFVRFSAEFNMKVPIIFG